MAGLGKTTPLESPIRSLKDLFDENGLPKFNLANTSLEEFIKPYYGGSDQLKAQVEKAKQYGQQNNLVSEKEYQKIFDPLTVQFFSSRGSFYKPEATLDNSGEKYPFVNIEKMRGESGESVYLPEFKKYKEGRMTDKEKKDFENFLELNKLSSKTYEKYIGPGREKSTSEHELGHHFVDTIAEDKPYSVEAPSHMSRRSELLNGIGRLQRETFQLTGKRFEDENELADYVRRTSLDDAMKNYSPEAQRTWKTLYENTKSTDKEQPSLLDWASKMAPALVKNSQKNNASAV